MEKDGGGRLEAEDRRQKTEVGGRRSASLEVGGKREEGRGKRGKTMDYEQ
jgi:hypothetical protein